MSHTKKFALDEDASPQWETRYHIIEIDTEKTRLTLQLDELAQVQELICHDGSCEVGTYVKLVSEDTVDFFEIHFPGTTQEFETCAGSFTKEEMLEVRRLVRGVGR